MSPPQPARRCHRRPPIVLLALLLSAAPFAAPPAGAQAPDSTGWSASGELSFTDVSGNTDLSLLATSLTVERSGGAAYDATGAAAVRYGTNDGEVAAKSAIASTEVRLRPLARLSPFATASVERDEVRRLLVRVAGALGVDVNLIREEARRLSIGGAVLQDYEKRDALEGSLADPSVSTTRFVMRLTGQTPLREGIALEHESRIEPAAEDFSDYLLRSQTALRAVLSSRLAFQTSYLFTRDNIPPEGVAFKDDRMLMVGLVVQLTPPAAP
jgi:putative salt-induced outer membrane protein YdiY